MKQRRAVRSQASAEQRFNEVAQVHLAGSLEKAISGYREVISLANDYAPAHNNLGTLLAQRGDLESASTHFHRAVELQPDYAEAVHNLGLAFVQRNQASEAIGHLHRAVELGPNRAEWWLDFANALLTEHRNEEALIAFDRAINIAPDSLVALSNRALALRGLHRPAEAIAACEAALTRDPSYFDALNNLSIIYKEQRKFPAARETIVRALVASPGNPAARTNLAVLDMELDQHESALVTARDLVRDHPEFPEAWNILGNLAHEQGELTEAESMHQHAIALDPRNSNANWNLSVLWLLAGDFARGLPQYEMRKHLTSLPFNRRHFSKPEWDGSPLAARCIFIHSEQGIGDLIQFSRYTKVLKRLGAGRIILECPTDIADLMRTVAGVDEVVSAGDPIPVFDVHCYLMSLPWHCGTTLANIPAEARYLEAPRSTAVQALGPHTGERRVGLAWAGNPIHQRDKIRSIPLARLAPLLNAPNTRYFSLQKGASTADLSSVPEARDVVNLDRALRSFSDTAAIIEELDLVITVDTSVAHLAAALGKPTWLLLPKVPDWRWMIGRDDSPWYPSMRLIRQTVRRDWDGVVARVRSMLDEWQPASQPVTGTFAGLPTAATAPRAVDFVEIDWPCGPGSGWGTYGMHLAVELEDIGHARPVLLQPPVFSADETTQGTRLKDMAHATPDGHGNATVRLVALGNGLMGAASKAVQSGTRQAGVVFFEDTAIDAPMIARSRIYDLIVTGSTFNAELLKAFGIAPVAMVLQGVDPLLFHPAPRKGRFGDRFVVFSGGKLEFRKGQDIVIAAFRQLLDSHPDALLVTAWHNHWPSTMVDIDAMGYVQGLPSSQCGRMQTTVWLAANGIPSRNVLDLGLQPQAALAQVLRECTVAAFPNRCEGGTNLVAMEAMASGIPTVLSANSGHLNLIGADTCFALEQQADIQVRSSLYRSTWGWGESTPDELCAVLHYIADHPDDAHRVGAHGARLLGELPWSRQAAFMLSALEAIQ